MEPISTKTKDGWILRGELRRGIGAASAVVVAGHAMWVDRRTLDRPAGRGLLSTLIEHGLHTMSFDLRGHGESGPLPQEGARFSYDEFVQYDLPAMVAEARIRFPSLPVFVLGHSLTGHAALIAAGLAPAQAPAGIVAVAANLWLPRLEPNPLFRLGKGLVLAMWFAASAPLGYFDARRVRLGSSGVPSEYVRQYMHNYRQDRLMSSDQRLDYAAALGHVRTPILSIASTGDRLLARPIDVDRFLDLCRRAPVTRRVVTDGDIDPAPDHMELVIADRCRPVWEEIAGWIGLEVERK